MELWLIRHGQTADNHLKILAGHQPGKLSELGVTQAQKTGKRLAKEKFLEVYCSDLGRAKETLENILISHPSRDKLSVNYSELLREKGARVLEGQPLIVWKNGAEKAGLGIRKYKAENAESWEDVMARADKFVEELIENYITSKNQPQSHQEEEKSNQNISNVSHVSGKFEETKLDLTGKSIKPVGGSKPVVKQTDKKSLPKILVVTHGGWIMEFFNVINFRKSGQKPIFLNNTSNCSVNVVKIYESSTPSGKKNLIYDIVNRNDVTHLSAGAKLH